MTRTGSEWNVATETGETSAAWDPAASGDGRVVFVCGHGAGGHMGDRAVLALSATLRSRGLDVVRFNFPYRQRGSGRPDPMPKLLSCFSAVVSRVREELRPGLLLIGGRSMGGRAASVLASEGNPCHGVLLFAYPLHPPGHPEKLRTAHLSSIAVPVLCFSGTRDDFCRRDLMEAVVGELGARWTLHWLEGADHSFHVQKRSGSTEEAVLAEVGDITKAWVSTLSR